MISMLTVVLRVTPANFHCSSLSMLTSVGSVLEFILLVTPASLHGLCPSASVFSMMLSLWSFVNVSHAKMSQDVFQIQMD